MGHCGAVCGARRRAVFLLFLIVRQRLLSLAIFGQPIILVGNLQHDALVFEVDNLFSKRARFLREKPPVAGRGRHSTGPPLCARPGSPNTRIRSLEKVSGKGPSTEGIRDGPPENSGLGAGKVRSPGKTLLRLCPNLKFSDDAAGLGNSLILLQLVWPMCICHWQNVLLLDLLLNWRCP